MVAAVLLGVAAVTPVAEGRQLSAARATFKVSLQGSYTATATAPYDSCSRWEPRADRPGEYELKSFTMTAKATETAKLHTTKPAILKLAGPYGGIPLTVEGQHYGRETVAIDRSSNVHSEDGAPDGCESGFEPGSPQQSFPGDCGSRSRKPGIAAGSSGGRSNRTKISIFAGYSLSDPFHCLPAARRRRLRQPSEQGRARGARQDPAARLEAVLGLEQDRRARQRHRARRG